MTLQQSIQAAVLPLPTPIEVEVVTQYDTPMPVGLTVDLRYSNYTIDKDYVLITAWNANIRQQPDGNSMKVGKAARHEKLQAIALVRGKYSSSYQTDLWFEVVKQQGNLAIHGYILASLAEYRQFQFQKMVDAYTMLKSEVDQNQTAYIANYKNRSGIAPMRHGQIVDAFGVKRYQSAPAYFSESPSSDFRYLPDGTLLTFVGETEQFYRVRTFLFDYDVFVPKKYVSLKNSIEQLTQVIVVDRKNQNEGVFEYANGQWSMISFSYATTGENARYKEPTPLGFYMAIERASKFIYLDDVTRLIAGYAPYAIRFSGGSYLHGVPVDFAPGQVVDNRILAWAPMREYLSTIGTVPRSHKCVRNYTSHAKFLYDWVIPGKASIIIIE
ncbi:MAG: L,D-transpeptidase [Eubacteriales bacterium]|nr:L,D-transpeptidase [Eubacteriales bacterium]